MEYNAIKIVIYLKDINYFNIYFIKMDINYKISNNYLLYFYNKYQGLNKLASNFRSNRV